MAIREYKRICKQAGCGKEFIVSAPSMDEDRAIGFSEPEYCPTHRALHARSYSRIACHHFEIELTPTGEQLVREIERQKATDESANGRQSKQPFDPWAMPGRGLGPGGLGRFQRPPRAFEESTEYRPVERQFAIAQKREEILAALEAHQVVVLVGTTGSGKSTYVPWMLLTDGKPGQLSKWARRGPICVTQPRIQATRQVPRFIANSLNGTSLGAGAQIGFSHSNADEYDRRTRLLFMTDGKLINDIVSGAISNYSIVMIDEAHERSANIDLILGLLKDQLYLYPHLRVIVASATIDFEAFLGYFYPSLADSLKTVTLDDFDYFAHEGRIPFVYSTARRFPITRHFWDCPPEEDAIDDQQGQLKRVPPDPIPEWWTSVNGGELPSRDQLPRAITDLVKQLCDYLDEPSTPKDEQGHILVFLPGSREIDQTVSLVNALGLRNVVSLPLYSQRPLDEQEAALNPNPKDHPKVHGKRRVVVSTNVAETSLTVEGVKYVIDTGYIKESYWNPTTEISELLTVRHSKAGCRQRWGRAGRVSSGHAYMLYTKNEFEEAFPVDSTPSIARSSLEQVLLTAKAAGVRTSRDPDRLLEFDWMPLAKQEDRDRFAKELARAYATLRRRNAIDGDGDLTKYGLELRGMPAALDVARIFTEGERFAMGVEVATLLPFMKLDYGLQTILLWDRNWDSATKLTVRLNHLDLVHGCRDDLDLYLKLWMLWEAQTDRGRSVWAERSGVNHTSFEERIELERRKFLEGAMDWRKAERRPIAVAKLDALRALIASAIPEEIYVPDVPPPATEEPSANAGSGAAPLSWESYWDAPGQYQEYDDDVDFEDGFGAPVGGVVDVFRRRTVPFGQADESALIEIAPTSICAGRADARCVVACQRRANFRRPARAKALGMNMISLDPAWLEDLQGSVVRRSRLYARLSRHRDAAEVRRAEVRLFLPWLAPRGTRVSGMVRSWDRERGALVDLAVDGANAVPLAHLRGQPLAVVGWLPAEACALVAPLANGQEIAATIVGYAEGEFGADAPRVELALELSQRAPFERFRRQYRVGAAITVEMRQVLEDPLGRSPMFIVREPHSGLVMPMADTDFCGNTHPQGYFGRRFAVGECFEVDVVAIDPGPRTVTLSRARLLLHEYVALPPRGEIVEVRIVREDVSGVFLQPTGSAYVGFVRRSLWPAGFIPVVGETVRASFRKFDRQLDPRDLRQRLKDGDPWPEESDFGIELDLRIPPAFDRFAAHNPLGSRISVTVEKPLGDGGLLVAINDVLKARIFDSELGFDEDGQIHRARDYPPGKILSVRVVQLDETTATVRCSIWRMMPLPITLPAVIEARIIKARTDRNDAELTHLTCAWPDAEGNLYQVYARVAGQDAATSFALGDVVQLRVERADRTISLIRGAVVA